MGSVRSYANLVTKGRKVAEAAVNDAKIGKPWRNTLLTHAKKQESNGQEYGTHLLTYRVDLSDVRSGTHYGLKSDLAPSPKVTGQRQF